MIIFTVLISDGECKHLNIFIIFTGYSLSRTCLLGKNGMMEKQKLHMDFISCLMHLVYSCTPHRTVYITTGTVSTQCSPHPSASQ